MSIIADARAEREGRAGVSPDERDWHDRDCECVPCLQAKLAFQRRRADAAEEMSADRQRRLIRLRTELEAIRLPVVDIT